MSQQGEDDGQEQRLAVRDEDLVEAKDKLGTQGPLKSKTYEVMAECEKAGKAAPSVFSSARSGGETAFSKTANQRPLRK
ncbi:musculoskeletal embryonic nuclear protein 1a [Gadus macrocephalus]|uniref:musculoskeletal embryonic nuclear protein 1a n=1 Tax=Gadus macrocephalus TaxID=80720 RepID=UPI0028CB184E|nr:musculoskeletal embryonic nuclear protein 1a [Gadus macrocephalus]